MVSGLASMIDSQARLDINIELDYKRDLEVIRECQDLGILNNDVSKIILKELESLSQSLLNLDSSDKGETYWISQEIGIPYLPEEVEEMLFQYFYILELIIRCKKAAVRVSPQVWAGIKSRMVTVPD